MHLAQEMNAALQDMGSMRAATIHLHLCVASNSSVETVAAALDRVCHFAGLLADDDDSVDDLTRELILITMKRYNGFATIQAYGCKILAALLVAHDESSRRLRLTSRQWKMHFMWKTNVMNSILNGMRRHTANDDVHEYGMLALYNLKAPAVWVSAGVGVIEIILAALRRFEESTTLQVHGYCILGHIPRVTGVDGTDVFPRIVSTIWKAMRCHRGDAKVQGYRLYALEHFTLHAMVRYSNTSIYEEITSKEGIDEIFAVMRRHDKDATVQEHGCGLLASLSVYQRTHRAVRRGIHLVLTAMEMHPEVVSVQANGCHFLTSYPSWCAPRKLVKQVIEVGGVGAILTAMRRHESDEKVQKFGFQSLCTIASPSIGKVAIGLEGGIGTIIATMRRHANHSELQDTGCLLLAELANRNYDNQLKISSEGGVAAILDVIPRFPRRSYLQHSAFLVLRRLACRSNTCAQIVSEGGIATLVNAVQFYPWILSKKSVGDCCLIMRSLAKNGNVEQLELAGAVDAIQIALEFHLQFRLVQRVGKDILKMIETKKRKRVRGASPTARAIFGHGNRRSLLEVDPRPYSWNYSDDVTTCVKISLGISLYERMSASSSTVTHMQIFIQGERAPKSQRCSPLGRGEQKTLLISELKFNNHVSTHESDGRMSP